MGERPFRINETFMQKREIYFNIYQQLKGRAQTMGAALSEEATLELTKQGKTPLDIFRSFSWSERYQLTYDVMGILPPSETRPLLEEAPLRLKEQFQFYTPVPIEQLTIETDDVPWLNFINEALDAASQLYPGSKPDLN